MAATTYKPTPSTAGSSIWTAPKWVTSFYAKFPLVQYEQEDELEWKSKSRSDAAECSLWVHPSTSDNHPHYRSWASSNPSSLRAQLLFLLRDPPVRVTFRPWINEESAPGSKLPALHVTEDSKLVASDDIRSWLDSAHPLKGKGKELQGLPSQEAYDKALAIAQLVLGRLLPAYLISLPRRPSNIHLCLPIPPMLSAGLTTPLPASLTGDARNVDKEDILKKGVEALDALETLLGSSDWALGASRPTPLDALIASHIYAVYSLDSPTVLRSHVEGKASLDDYVERVMSHASSKAI